MENLEFPNRIFSSYWLPRARLLDYSNMAFLNVMVKVLYNWIKKVVERRHRSRVRVFLLAAVMVIVLSHFWSIEPPPTYDHHTIRYPIFVEDKMEGSIELVKGTGLHKGKTLLNFANLISAESRSEKCNGIPLHIVDKEILRPGLFMAHDLMLLENNLYFSFGKDSQMARIDLDTMKLIRIENVTSFSQTVDLATNNIYFSGHGRIFNYDPVNKTIDHVAPKDALATKVYYFNNELYYIDFATETLHKFRNDHTSEVEGLQNETAYDVVIDDEGTFFFFNEELKSLARDGKMSSYTGSEYLQLQALAADGGDVLACTASGIYSVNKQTRALDNLIAAETRPCIGLVVKGRYIIYSNGDDIIIMKKTTKCLQIDS